jgi:aminoglycoside phosphotransferase (APT) family kinase protein
MQFDTTVSDASFVDGRPPKDIKEIIEWAREQLGLDSGRPWCLISARTKLGRTLFEIEEETSFGPRRFIGKLGRTERAEVLHRTLTLLRNAGFQPPSRMTVPEPIAYLPERGLVLQEKVPGRQATDLLLQSSGRACFAAADCARWLAALHECPVPASPAAIDVDAISRWARELGEAQPDDAGRVDAIANAVLEELTKPISDVRPSHGDFHPMNIFIAGTQRITGIDIDKFAAREPEADIGWFLMQTSVFGFFKTGTFASTGTARRAFVQCYEAETGRSLRARRVALYIAMGFLKNLHFELVLLKTGRTEYCDPWLKAAASAILEGDLYISENS